MEIVPADRYTFEQLTEAYNQTRVDYLVPMPMNVARLREYAHVYDVNMAGSCVAVEGMTMLGLGMLGVRDGRAWITRLGVLPSGRRKGVGNALMAKLLEQAQQRGIDTVWLEVIKGNVPAHNLFRKFGFEETRELIVATRPTRMRPFPLPTSNKSPRLTTRKPLFCCPIVKKGQIGSMKPKVYKIRAIFPPYSSNSKTVGAAGSPTTPACSS